MSSKKLLTMKQIRQAVTAFRLTEKKIDCYLESKGHYGEASSNLPLDEKILLSAL